MLKIYQNKYFVFFTVSLGVMILAALAHNLVSRKWGEGSLVALSFFILAGLALLAAVIFFAIYIGQLIRVIWKK